MQGEALQSSTNVMPDLAMAMKTNPDLKVFLNGGYYDLATPFYATEFDLGHLGLEQAISRNISYGFYPSGHMIYFDVPSLKQVRADLGHFYDSATHP